MTSTLRSIGLAGSPAVTGSSAGLTAYRLTHSLGASLEFAALAGVLTLGSLLALSIAHLAESWICHRSEHDFSYTVRRTVKVAIGAQGERRDAALAAAEKLGITDLARGANDAMEITRGISGYGSSSRLQLNASKSAGHVRDPGNLRCRTTGTRKSQVPPMTG